MNKLFIISAILFLSCSISAVSQTKFKADDIIGQWYTADSRAVVEIFKKDDKYCGKIVWVNEKDRGKKDVKNPNEKLRTRLIEGITFMKGFTFNEEDQCWEKGKVYDPESGNIYGGTLKLKDKNNYSSLLPVSSTS